jgi:hypothetical protein
VCSKTNSKEAFLVQAEGLLKQGSKAQTPKKNYIKNLSFSLHQNKMAKITATKADVSRICKEFQVRKWHTAHFISKQQNLPGTSGSCLLSYLLRS